MLPRLGIILVLGLVVVAGAVAWVMLGRPGVAVGGHPRIFDQRAFATVKASAASANRILLVKFTASWCPPCKEMDATTLVDPRVEAWVKDHALAVEVDIDEQPELSDQFAVEGIPTFVAMRGDARLSQTIGYQSADEFLAWLKGLESP